MIPFIAVAQALRLMGDLGGKRDDGLSPVVGSLRAVRRQLHFRPIQRPPGDEDKVLRDGASKIPGPPRRLAVPLDKGIAGPVGVAALRDLAARDHHFGTLPDPDVIDGFLHRGLCSRLCFGREGIGSRLADGILPARNLLRVGAVSAHRDGDL